MYQKRKYYFLHSLWGWKNQWWMDESHPGWGGKRQMTNNRRWWSIERKWQQSDKQSSYWAGFLTPVKTGQEAMCHFKWRKRIKCDQLTKTGYFKARRHLSRQESSRDGEVMRQSRASCCLCALQMSTHLITTYTGPAGHHTTAGSNNLFITYRFHTTTGLCGGGLSHWEEPLKVCRHLESAQLPSLAESCVYI